MRKAVSVCTKRRMRPGDQAKCAHAAMTTTEKKAKAMANMRVAQLRPMASPRRSPNMAIQVSSSTLSLPAMWQQKIVSRAMGRAFRGEKSAPQAADADVTRLPALWQQILMSGAVDKHLKKGTVQIELQLLMQCCCLHCGSRLSCQEDWQLLSGESLRLRLQTLTLCNTKLMLR